MSTSEAIASEQEKLYESASLRDDLNDAEATVLLQWGEKQVEVMANRFPNDFEQKARFLRQLIKNINRFVGQREFNEMDGQQKYMENVVKYLQPLGYITTQDELFAALPEDKTHMMANLKAILNVLTPELVESAPEPDVPHEGFRPNFDATEAIPDIHHLLHDDKKTTHANTQQQTVIPNKQAQDNTESDYRSNFDATEVIPDVHDLIDTDAGQTEVVRHKSDIEASDTQHNNQPDQDTHTGENIYNGEEEEQ
jgi:hypothetical protein